MKVLELAQCPSCGATAFQTFDLGAGNHLRRCTGCQTISALSYADPAEVYVDGYMFGEAGTFGINAMDPVFQRYLARVADRRIRMIERATKLREASLLDVGCGTGEVLAAAQQRGWRTVGVEPERSGAEIARGRGLEVHIALLEEAGLPERSFDVVSAFHVLEHMPDSRAFLTMLRRWVRPGGFVSVEVPNWDTMQRRRLRQGWSGLRPGEHLVHYTPRTLVRTLRAAGIEPVLVRSPTYVGPPQHLGHALHDFGRYGRVRHMLRPFSRLESDGERRPTHTGWALLRTLEMIHDRAGVGSVVFCIGTVS